MNRNLYLAGAISYYFPAEQQEHLKNWRNDVKKYVNKHYHDITITAPADFYKIGGGYHDHRLESEVMRFGLRMVREADLILVNLRELEYSMGTSDEIFYAFISGKPVIGFLDNKEEMKEVHPWKMEQIDRIETGKNAIQKALNYIYRYYVVRESQKDGR